MSTREPQAGGEVLETAPGVVFDRDALAKTLLACLVFDFPRHSDAVEPRRGRRALDIVHEGRHLPGEALVRAERGRFPAVDPVLSLSRSMNALVDPDHRAAAARVRALCAAYERQRDLILLGAYRKGSDPETDEAIARMPAIEAFLRQDPREASTLDETLARLRAI